MARRYRRPMFTTQLETPASPSTHQAMLAIVVIVGMVAGIGFAGYALHGNAVALQMIEYTMMWCM
jgi:hypothetical protein